LQNKERPHSAQEHLGILKGGILRALMAGKGKENLVTPYRKVGVWSWKKGLRELFLVPGKRKRKKVNLYYGEGKGKESAANRGN